MVELPPRARRIRLGESGETPAPGTTSACAENTAGVDTAKEIFSNYLRVRGEYYFKRSFETLQLELPPRARRILAKLIQENANLGTTSACAENTPAHGAAANSWRNYLRVRGEYTI